MLFHWFYERYISSVIYIDSTALSQHYSMLKSTELLVLKRQTWQWKTKFIIFLFSFFSHTLSFSLLWPLGLTILRKQCIEVPYSFNIFQVIFWHHHNNWIKGLSIFGQKNSVFQLFKHLRYFITMYTFCIGACMHAYCYMLAGFANFI